MELIRKELITVRLSKYEQGGNIVVTVDNIPSGMTVHFGDGDLGAVTFRFDASRFNVMLQND